MRMFEEIKAMIQANIPDALVEIDDLTGTANHLGLTIVSDSFQGLPLLEQHRKVMDLLAERLQRNLHAVKIKTMTHARYQNLKK